MDDNQSITFTPYLLPQWTKKKGGYFIFSLLITLVFTAFEIFYDKNFLSTNILIVFLFVVLQYWVLRNYWINRNGKFHSVVISNLEVRMNGYFLGLFPRIIPRIIPRSAVLSCAIKPQIPLKIPTIIKSFIEWYSGTNRLLLFDENGEAIARYTLRGFTDEDIQKILAILNDRSSLE